MEKLTMTYMYRLRLPFTVIPMDTEYLAYFAKIYAALGNWCTIEMCTDEKWVTLSNNEIKELFDTKYAVAFVNTVDDLKNKLSIDCDLDSQTLKELQNFMDDLSDSFDDHFDMDLNQGVIQDLLNEEYPLVYSIL